MTNTRRKCQHSTGFGILVLAVVGRPVMDKRGVGQRLRGSIGRGWGSLVMRGRGGRRSLRDVFVLTAVMHGVAGDDHR